MVWKVVAMVWKVVAMVICVISFPLVGCWGVKIRIGFRLFLKSLDRRFKRIIALV